MNILIGTKVQVYWNFPREVYSVQAKVNGNWKVVDHTTEITLKDVKFKVSEAGRQRVLREKKKNVHAKICGTEIEFNDLPRPIFYDYKRISYNPYRSEKFQALSAFYEGESIDISEAGIVKCFIVDNRPMIKQIFLSRLDWQLANQDI